jgi:hypothetical protein
VIPEGPGQAGYLKHRAPLPGRLAWLARFWLADYRVRENARMTRPSRVRRQMLLL